MITYIFFFIIIYYFGTYKYICERLDGSKSYSCTYTSSFNYIFKQKNWIRTDFDQAIGLNHAAIFIIL